MSTVFSLHRSAGHTFGKARVDVVELVAGIGVLGDAHAGAQVRHRSRVRADPTQPNLRQVHLLHRELLDDLAEQGSPVEPGQLGENITTEGLDLLGLPAGAMLSIGPDVVVGVTGLRNPCGQIEAFRTGLLDSVRRRHDDGGVERLAGVMAVVIRGGIVRRGDPILVSEPAGPQHRLEPV